MKTYLHLSILVLLLSTSCQEPVLNWTIQTVKGSVNTVKLGKTLIHEHILVDFIGADSTDYHRWDRAAVIEKVLPYPQEIKALGYETIIDCTPAYLGRDPQLLKMLSEQSGLYILTNTGFYGARNNQFVPDYAYRESAGQLADHRMKQEEEILEGIRIYLPS